MSKRAEVDPNRWSLPYVLRSMRSPSIVAPYVKKKEVSSAVIRLALAFGVSPFGPPPGFEEAGETYHVDASIPIGFVKDRWDLSKASVVFSNGGSHELLERIITQVLTFPRAEKKEPTVKVIGIAPQFPEIATFVNRSPRMTYGSIPPTSLTRFFDKNDDQQIYDSRVQELLTIQRQSKNIAIYLDNPNNPTGDVAKLETIKKLAEHCAKKEWLLIVDEAFGDALEDDQSAIPLTEEHPFIVLRSLSKIIGLHRERIGYAVMNPEIEEKFNYARRVLDWSASAEQISEQALHPKILKPHLTRVRGLIREINQRLMEGLDGLGVHYAHTDEAVPIQFIDGQRDDTALKLASLSTAVISGSSFFPTDNRLSDRQIRVSTPATPRLVNLFLQRLDGAMKSGITI